MAYKGFHYLGPDALNQLFQLYELNRERRSCEALLIDTRKYVLPTLAPKACQ